MADGKQEFGFSDILLYKAETLGAGSYGRVCRAKCDGLPCAAKILHPTLFDMHDPGSASFLQKFRAECNLLSRVRHPNIVQYLATHCDPDTKLPVLLMELCDESLCRFLERSVGPLPYHTELNISHDITLALVYLHTNGLIHRDLTGNNVLMIAGVRAKVTDFGMSKLASVNPRMTPLTTCPGNMLYMSPEALQEPPSYTDKLDIFSLGVLLVQIMTRQFPNPDTRFQVVSIQNDSRFPGGTVNVPVSEAQRRKTHLDLISNVHHLKAIALKCLMDKENERPSAKQVNDMFTELKDAPQYAQNVDQTQDVSSRDKAKNEVSRTQVQELEHRNQKQKQEIDKCQHDIQQLQAKQQQLKQKVDSLEQQLQAQQVLTETESREKQRLHCMIQDKERELQQLQHTSESREREFEANKKLIASYQLSLQQKDATIHDFQQTVSTHESKIRYLEQQVNVSNAQPQQVPVVAQNAVIKFEERQRMWSQGMLRGSAVVYKNTAYINPDRTNEVFSYQFFSGLAHWEHLPNAALSQFSLVVIDGYLTYIGGWNNGYYYNTLFTLIDSQWIEFYPSMPSVRGNAAAVSTDEILVVAGGCDGRTVLDTVEVMTIFSKQWTTVSCMPHPYSMISATVCGDRLYLSGGFVGRDVESMSVLTCSLTALVPSHGQPLETGLQNLSLARSTIWQRVRELPVTQCTLATLSGHIIAIGGKDTARKPTTDILMYDYSTDSWQVIGKMEIARRLCFVIVFPDDKIHILGGDPPTDVVEIGTFHISRMRL